MSMGYTVVVYGRMYLTLSCPGTGRAVVKIGHSNLRPGSKELTMATVVPGKQVVHIKQMRGINIYFDKGKQ